MDGIGPHDLNIASLMQRLELLNTTPEKDKVEVIFALPATMEGETTAFYVFRKLAPLTVEVTAIARGLAVGEDLQHADEATLVQSPPPTSCLTQIKLLSWTYPLSLSTTTFSIF